MRQHAKLGATVACLLCIGAGLEAFTRDAPLGPPTRSDALILFLATSAALGATFSTRAASTFTRSYLTVFFLFHFGLLPTFIFKADLPDLLSGNWISSSRLTSAYGLAAIALGSGCLASVLYKSSPETLHSRLTPQRGAAFRSVGAALVLTGSLGWFFIALVSAGPSVFVGDYLTFLNATPGLPLSFTYLALSMGTVLYLGTYPGRLRATPTLIVLIATNLVLLRVGFRGEVMMPAVASMSLRYLRNAGPGVARVAAALIGALAVIPGLRAVRLDSGLGSLLRLNPVDGAAELGFTIRPVAASFDLIHEEGLRFGETYWGVLFRALENFGVTGSSPEPLNVEVLSRIGPVGFSPVAEGFLNFGLAGAALSIPLTVLVLRKFERQHSETGQVIGGLILAVMLYQVRNTFTQVPFQITASLMVVWLCLAISGATRTGTGSATSNSTSPFHPPVAGR